MSEGTCKCQYINPYMIVLLYSLAIDVHIDEKDYLCYK